MLRYKKMNQFFITRNKLFWIILFIFAATGIHAKIPAHIHFQGMLTDNAGKLVEKGQHVLIFSIWDQQSPSNKTPLWQERHLVTVENGVYNVLLGSHIPFADPDQKPSTDDGLSFSVPYYMDIQYQDRSLTSNGKLFPLTTVWTAFRANTSEGRLVRSIQKDHAIVSGDDIIFAQSGRKITLPKAADNKGRLITIKKADNLKTGVFIHCLDSDLITAPQTANAAKCPVTLTQAFEDLSLVSDGNIWWGMGQHYISMDQIDLTDRITAKDIKNGSITKIDISPKAGIAYNQLSLLQSIQGKDIADKSIQASHIHSQSIANIHIADSAEIALSPVHCKHLVLF
jgi:hypothetical protein